MILVDRDASERWIARGVWGRATLDGLLARAAAARPDAPALLCTAEDAGSGFLSWRDVDRRVSNLAGHLLDCGLRQDEIVGMRLPNTSESFVAVLAALRAGLVPAMLPLPWRQRELLAAARRTAPAALVTARDDSETCGGELARRIAADCGSVRHVFGFGEALPDGIARLDAVAGSDAAAEGTCGLPRHGNPADHVAVVTFRSDPEGPTPLARSHNQWLAAAAALAVDARIGPGATIAVPMLPSSFAGLAGGLASWLLAGCRLVLLGPVGMGEALRTAAAHGATHLMLPGPVAAPARTDGPRIIRFWSDASRAPAQPKCDGCIDVVSLDEIALWTPPAETAGPLPLGAPTPEEAASDPRRHFVEARLHGHFQRADASVAAGSMLSGALRVAGPQAPGARLPLSRRTDARAGPGPGGDGFWPTGLRGRLVATRPARGRITGHLAETAFVGGMSVQLAEADRLYAGCPDLLDAACIAVPDAVFGTRLAAAVVHSAGRHIELAALRTYLVAEGVGTHMLPSRLVRVASIPRAPDGTVLRGAIEGAQAA